MKNVIHNYEFFKFYNLEKNLTLNVLFFLEMDSIKNYLNIDFELDTSKILISSVFGLGFLYLM